jgi:hypothetical protein
MSHPDPFSSWKETVSSAFPHLSRPQATVLALWSYGMVLAKACGITLVSAALALQFGWKEATLVQRLREWCYAAPDKKGTKRREVDVRTCFAPLLRWLLSWWPAEVPRLALALDATTLSDRFTVLAVSVLYRGCAIPVAWKVVAAGAKGAWQPYWKDLLTDLHDGVPQQWSVLVMTDRGLYAPWLYQQIVALGWHPFLRINQQGHFRPVQVDTFRPLSALLPKVGSAWCGEVVCFSQPKSRLRCTLLAQWEEGSEEGWLLLTDLSPAAAEVAWYAMRSWIEGGFKDIKRGGWQWHQTKMTDPARAERLWLALAVATVWVVSVGGEVDANVPLSSLVALPETHVARRNASGRPRPRILSCFARGLLAIVGALIRGEGLLFGRFHPEPWPASPPAHLRGDEEVQKGYGQVGDDFVEKTYY